MLCWHRGKAPPVFRRLILRAYLAGITRARTGPALPEPEPRARFRASRAAAFALASSEIRIWFFTATAPPSFASLVATPLCWITSVLPSRVATPPCTVTVKCSRPLILDRARRILILCSIWESGRTRAGPDRRRGAWLDFAVEVPVPLVAAGAALVCPVRTAASTKARKYDFTLICSVHRCGSFVCTSPGRRG
jgi:hypothetical protein